MMPHAANGIIETLADPRLLDPEAFEQLVDVLYPICSDWAILSPEIVYRGWLTRYQMREVLAGRGNDLVMGRYTIEEPLGEGGMGRVFRARNWRLNKSVAIKVIRSEQAQNPAIVKRFIREISVLGRVSHPNIVLAFDAEAQGNTLYYAMEYIPGRDLGWSVRELGPLSISATCMYIAQVAHALQHVHEWGIVHRDIKPSNLILTSDESTVKLLDLGLTRCDLVDQDESQVTRVGSLIGTPDYIAPEQIQDPHQVDIRADLYSLGCTMYYLLSGRAPFEDASIVQKLHLHSKQDPVPIEVYRPDTPVEVRSILKRLLAKKPSRRYRDPGELFAALMPMLRSSWVSSSAETLDGLGQATGISIPNPAPSLAPELPDEEQTTQIFSPSQIEIRLPAGAPAPAPKEPIEPWFRPLQMTIAIVTATVALLVLQILNMPRKVEATPATDAPTTQTDPK